MKRARLTLLGRLELSIEMERVRILPSGEHLLALLALSDCPLLRAQVAGVLWGDVPEERAAGNLRSALWRLPRCGVPVVETSPNHIWLAAGVEVDARAALRQALQILAPAPGPAVLGVDERLLLRDLLPGWYEDWVVIERERYRQARLHALERLATLRSANGDYAGAIQAAIGAIEGEPLRESANRVLIEVHLAEGNRSEALRQYRAFRALLHDELQVEPSPLMAALFDRCKAHAAIRTRDTDRVSRGQR